MIDLRLGDCLNVMGTMPDGCVDAVVTDPPYGQSNESYDRGVPAEVWAECFRVCKSNAVLISFAGSPTYHRIATGIEYAGWHVRQMWGWIYRDGMITSAWPKEGFDRLAPAMDPICFATKGKVLLNLDREGESGWVHGKRKCNLSARSDGDDAAEQGHGHWPKSIVSDDSPGFEYFAYRRAQKDADPTGHPNQKPLSLMRWIVRKLPRGVILDPYAGSGTTLIAADCEGHEAIGVESDPAYFAIAERRIRSAMLPLFGAP